MTSLEFDQSKADAFAERMLGVLNDAALALMTSIGHRTGLFDTISEMPPSSSSQIAQAAGLNERYVREWLGAMVVGRLIDYDPEGETYHLPAEHAASLTRAATPNNMAMFMQYVALLGAVEDRIVECFHKGGGGPYSAYGRFQQVMAEESSQTVGAALITDILPMIPGGIESLEAGVDVLDVGCGRGHSINLMAAAFPASRFSGYDFSEDGIAAAREEARRMGLSNVRFETKDVTTLGEHQRYDLITAFDAIHDQAEPRKVLRGIAEALREGGTFLMQDIAASSHLHENLNNPIAPFLYSVSCMHCMTVSLALDGEGLGTMWGEEKARELLVEAGFTRVEVKRLSHDIQNSYFVVRKD